MLIGLGLELLYMAVCIFALDIQPTIQRQAKAP